jgi:hypothetical protein
MPSGHSRRTTEFGPEFGRVECRGRITDVALYCQYLVVKMAANAEASANQEVEP